MRIERKARISGLAGIEHARNQTLPDLTFPVTEWDLGTRLDETLNNDHGSTEQSKTRFQFSVPLCIMEIRATTQHFLFIGFLKTQH